MKKILYALLLTVFVLTISVGSADAAWTTGFGTAKKILQNASATTLASQSAAAAIIYTLGAGETLNTDDTVTITLTGGAKFSATPPTITTSAGAMSIVGSPTGLTTANFRVAFLASVGDTLIFNTNATIFNVSAATASVDVSVKAVTSVGGLTIFDKAQTTFPTVGPAFAFSAPQAMESVYVVASTNTADVSASTGAFFKFTGATLTGTAATFTYTNLSETVNTAPSGQEISAGKVVFNVAGILTGITSISGTGCTGSSSTGSTTGGLANFFLIDTAKTNAYCVNTAVIAPQGAVALAPVFILDGTTAQAARGFTASVNFLADGTKWAAHSALAATALYSITRNGSSFVSNSIGARNTIKITDRSAGVAAAGGAITVTAWDINGVSIPQSSTATALTIANNATTTITGPALAARFPTGVPIKYEFSIESSSIDVTNVKASTDGTFSATTVYTSGAGGAL